MKRLLITALWVAGVYFLGQGFYMEVKAKLSQVLISSSWQSRSEGSLPEKPWWWADTRAVARLEVPRLNKTLYVMQDDSGESLAFGPGYVPASVQPAQGGHTVIAGHRDSHFAFLKHIKIDDIITVENTQNIKQHYRVSEIKILDTRTQQVQLYDNSRLTLITCYPFESIVPGGPLRLIVNAEPIQNAQSIAFHKAK